MLQELYEAPQSDLVKRYELIEGKVITRTIAPTKKYGTALVALGFVDYIFPELKKR
jgi:hypothetical protein